MRFRDRENLGGALLILLSTSVLAGYVVKDGQQVLPEKNSGSPIVTPSTQVHVPFSLSIPTLQTFPDELTDFDSLKLHVDLFTGCETELLKSNRTDRVSGLQKVMQRFSGNEDDSHLYVYSPEVYGFYFRCFKQGKLKVQFFLSAQRRDDKGQFAYVGWVDDPASICQRGMIWKKIRAKEARSYLVEIGVPEKMIHSWSMTKRQIAFKNYTPGPAPTEEDYVSW